MSLWLPPRGLTTPSLAPAPMLNPAHPLAAGMIGAFLPGVSWANLVGDEVVLAPSSSAKVSVSREGPALLSDAASSGAYATAPSRFKSWTQFSLFWRGYFVGTPSNNTNMVGVSYTSTDTSPYNIFVIYARISGTISISCNNGTSLVEIIGPSRPSNFVQFSAGASATVNGNIVLYIDGAQVATGLWNSSNPPLNTSSSTIELGGYFPVQTRVLNSMSQCGYFFNRALSAEEHKQLHLAPYDMFDVGDWPALYLAGGFKPAWARNSNIILGARVA